MKKPSKKELEEAINILRKARKVSTQNFCHVSYYDQKIKNVFDYYDSKDKES